MVTSFIEAGNSPDPHIGKPEENNEIRESLLAAHKKREKTAKDLRLRRLGFGALAGTVLVTLASSYSVWSMTSSSAAERAIFDENTPELIVPTESLDFYKLSVKHPDDVWHYTTLYAKAENVALGKAMDIVADANPNVDFNDIPVDGTISVPALPFAGLAGQESLETDQPIDDVHIN